MNTYEMLVRENAQLLDQGIMLLDQLRMEDYGNSAERDAVIANSSGKHFRHVANFYQTFIESSNGRYNFDERLRDPNLEENPEYARTFFINLKDRLLTRQKNECTVFSWSGRSGEWIPSSEERELKFIFEHTVHHYALISLLLRTANISVPEEFGIAPSSIDYYSSNTTASL
jgi:uncharacterized damage-inducible protein DinB